MTRCPCSLRYPIDPAREDFCGLCGRKLKVVEAALDESGGSSLVRGSETLSLKLRLHNCGAITTAVTGLQWISPAMGRGAEMAARLPEPFALNSCQTVDCVFQVRVPEIARTASVLALKLVTSPEVDTETIRLEMKRPPRIEIVTADAPGVILLEVADEPGEWKKLRKPIQIRAIDQDIILADGKSIHLVVAEGSPRAPLLDAQGVVPKILRAGEAVELVPGDPSKFFSKETRDRDAFIELQVEGLAAPVRSRPALLRWRPPVECELKLDPPELKCARLLRGRCGEFSFKLINRTVGRPVTITELEIKLSDPLFAGGLKAEVISPHRLPFIMPATHVTQEFERFCELHLDAAKWSGQRASSKALLIVRVKDGRPLEFQIDIDVIAAAEEAMAPLAIDFGHTNTTVCRMDAPLPQIVPLNRLVAGRAANANIVRTAVLYRRPDGVASDWDARAVEVEGVGDRAWVLLRSEAHSYASRYVASFKPKIGLGLDHSFVQMPNVRRAYDQVLVDYLKEVVLSIEEETAKRYRRIILSHPVRFWTSQREALRDALLASMNVPNWPIHFIDEAAAVALFHASNLLLHSEAAAGGQYRESILVFDFGGGTIDIAVCLVEYENGRWRIRHLASDGTSSLGGDAITRIISHTIYENAFACLNGKPSVGVRLAGQSPPQSRPAAPADWGFDIDAAENGKSAAATIHEPEFNRWIIPIRHDRIEEQSSGFRAAAVWNEFNLFLWAEQLKIDHLSETPADHPTYPISLECFERTADSPHPVHRPIDFEVDYGQLRDLLIQRIKIRLSEAMVLVERTLAAVRDRSGEPVRLDRVLMAGQSSRLKLAQEMLAEVMARAGQPSALRPEVLAEAKEAVSMGAAIYGSYLDPRGRADQAEVELNRASRAYLFLRVPNYLMPYRLLVDRFAPLPQEVTWDDSTFGQIEIVESFVDLTNPHERRSAKEGEDYRTLCRINVSPEEEPASFQLTITADEQVTVAPLRRGESGEEPGGATLIDLPVRG